MTPLRVAVDLMHVRLSDAGTARYACELVAALRARDGVSVEVLREGPPLPRGARGRRRGVLAQDLVWYPVRATRAAIRAGAQLYHAPLPRGPLRRGRIPTVVTIHDLVALRHPGTMARWNRLYTRATLRRIAHTADLVFAPSHDTADDVVRALGVAPERVRVVYNGVGDRFFAAPPAPPIEPGYVLFVGTPEPRKNLPRLVAAVQSLGPAARLVIAGGDGWGGAPPADAPAVRWLGRVDDATLHALYGGAACVALPSLHEGFGLPALEAMAIGTPVVAARTGALPEVCAAAAVYVDPLSVASIADGLRVALADDDAGAAARRRARARHFSWAATAASAVAAYRELA